MQVKKMVTSALGVKESRDASKKELQNKNHEIKTLKQRVDKMLNENRKLKDSKNIKLETAERSKQDAERKAAAERRAKEEARRAQVLEQELRLFSQDLIDALVSHSCSGADTRQVADTWCLAPEILGFGAMPSG